MKLLQAIAFTSLSLLCLNTYAENTYIYRQEFKTFKESAEFTEIIDLAIDGVLQNAEALDEKQKEGLASALSALELILVFPETMPRLADFIEFEHQFYTIEESPCIIIKKPAYFDNKIETAFSSSEAIFMYQEFLLNATDEEVEEFIIKKLELLQQAHNEAAATSRE